MKDRNLMQTLQKVKEMSRVRPDKVKLSPGYYFMDGTDGCDVRYTIFVGIWNEAPYIFTFYEGSFDENDENEFPT